MFVKTLSQIVNGYIEADLNISVTIKKYKKRQKILRILNSAQSGGKFI